MFGLGLVLLAMKYFAFGPVAAWEWWVVLSPFGLATVWWSWADRTGYTKKKAMEREDQRRDDRRARTKKALDANYEKNQKNQKR